MALMEANGFTLDQFAENHPAGRIGRRSSMRVRDLMLGKDQIPLCSPEDRLENVLIDFTNKRCGCLIVIDEKDILREFLPMVICDGLFKRKGKKCYSNEWIN